MNPINVLTENTCYSIIAKPLKCLCWKGRKVTYIAAGSLLVNLGIFFTFIAFYGISNIPSWILGIGAISITALTCIGGCCLCCKTASEDNDHINNLLLESAESVSLISANIEENIEAVENIENNLMGYQETVESSQKERESLEISRRTSVDIINKTISNIQAAIKSNEEAL